MIYQMVLITSMGTITPLATFNDSIDCVREQAFIQKSDRYSVVCLPTQDPRQSQAQVEQGMQMLTEMMNRMKETMK